MSGTILRDAYRKIVMLYDVEVRFDCAGSREMRPPSLSGSISRGSYRHVVMLHDAEFRFDCAGFVREHFA